jgi:predicted metal-dependent TIM-barrel fold hydrolase
VVVRGDGEMFISQRYDFLVVIFSLRKTKKNELQNIYHMCDNSKTDDTDVINSERKQRVMHHEPWHKPTHSPHRQVSEERLQITTAPHEAQHPHRGSKDS